MNATPPVLGEGRTVELTVLERVFLLTTFPRQGDIATARMLRSLRKELDFAPVERERYQIKVGLERTEWKQDIAAEAAPEQFILSKEEFEFLRLFLKELSNKKLLRVECIELYEKFDS